MKPTWTPPDSPADLSPDGSAPTAVSAAPAAMSALEEATRAVEELEDRVRDLARGPGGPRRAQVLVVAARTSALLRVADGAAAGDDAVRGRVAALRARHDDALLRFGALAEDHAASRHALTLDLSSLAGAPGLRRLGRTVATSLILMGILLLGFAIYSVGFSHITYDRNQRLALDRLNKDIRQSAVIAAAAVAGDRNLAAVPSRGRPVALLEIPAIGMREVVVQGTGTRELRWAVGHYRPSPMPGQVGNAVLAGHRNLYGRPFARIGELRPGDRIAVTTQEGRFAYTVELSETAGTGDPDFLAQGTFVNRLTLLTTAPEGHGGRFAVVARLAGNAAALRIKDDPRSLKTDELGLGRDTSGWWPALGWGGAMLAALVTTAHLYRRWRRLSTHLVTTAPLLAIGLLWYEAVARLIPSTF